MYEGEPGRGCRTARSPPGPRRDPAIAVVGRAFAATDGLSCRVRPNPIDASPVATDNDPMATYIKSLTFDCRDALVVARFWAGALGGELEEDSTSDKAYVEAPGWGAPNMWFQRVPEPRAAKLRMHLDLRAPDGVAAEVKRLSALGATVADDQGALVVMQDPEGNEFCVEL